MYINIIITELPVGKWTSDYKQVLEGMMMGGSAKEEV
jgi:hypothetical protein